MGKMELIQKSVNFNKVTRIRAANPDFSICPTRTYQHYQKNRLVTSIHSWVHFETLVGHYFFWNRGFAQKSGAKLP